MRARLLVLIFAVALAACGGDDLVSVVEPVRPSATPTPTLSPTPTVTSTMTPTSTVSPSSTPSESPTVSPTSTPTPSATESPTITLTPTITISPTATVVPTLEPLEIHSDAQWIRDRVGRVVLLRGANYSGLEFGNLIGNRHGPEEADFAQMREWGFNVIRLPIAWSFIETAPNELSDTYLTEQVDQVVDFAARHDILVVIEMHQFQWSRCFTNGNGAPSWVCDGHDYPDNSSGQLQAGCDFFQGGNAPDGRPLMDHFVDLWRFVGAHYAGDTRVAGFDYFNEPIAYTCIPIAVFEQQVLNPLYRRIRNAVQEEGAAQTFFFTPSIVRNTGLPTLIEPFGPNVVYAPHLYTQTFGLPDRKYNGDARTITNDYALATREAGTLGGPLWAGEFGGNTNVEGDYLAATELFLRHTLEEQDRRLVGGAAWAYFPSDNTFSVVDADGNEKGELVNILARPYARRIAGIPTAMSFDVDTKVFELVFEDDPEVDAPDPTEIFVPAARHYPGGFTVEVSEGDSWSFDPESGQLLLVRGSRGEHRLHIRPSS